MKRLPLFLLSLGIAQFAFSQFTVTLLHSNDLHSHFEPVKIKGQELGGFSRMATLIKGERQIAKNPLVLNGGDNFQGTLFFNVYHGLADVAIMNEIGYQAAAVGNHEFDLGSKVLADFIRLAAFPVLAANLDVREDDDLKDLVRSYTIIPYADGQKVGIVGAVTPDLLSISSPGDKVKMKPLIESVQQAVDQLLAFRINKIFVVSHCGYALEKEMASKLKGVDVIVGGHSHTLLGNVTLPGDIKGGGLYPTVMKNADGDTCLVVQAWEWGKVLGKLEITFDDKGKVEKWSDNQPIPVTSAISEDPVVNAMVRAFKKPIEELMNKQVGEAVADIPRNGPGKQGVMADLITDAMLEATTKIGSVVAFMNAGGIRSALNAGKITYGDAISVQPFNNTLVQITLTGAEIQTALSSGILYVSAGSSFEMIDKQAKNIVIAGKPLDMIATYRCTFNNFVAGGGDAIDVVKNAKGERIDTGLLDIDAFIDTLKARSPLKLTSEQRIK